jgi:hypothetical protein
MSDVPASPMVDVSAPPSVLRSSGRSAFDTIVLLGVVGAVGGLAYRMMTLEERMQSLERRSHGGSSDAARVFRPVPQRSTSSAYQPLSATDDEAPEEAPTADATDECDRSDASVLANAAPRKRSRKGKAKTPAAVVPTKEKDEGDEDDEEAPPPSGPSEDVPRDDA